MTWTRQLLRGVCTAFSLACLTLSAAPAHAQGAKFATVRSQKCNIYQEPNEASPVTQRVTRGTYLEVRAVKGMWVKVHTDSVSVGYVLKTDVIPGKKDLGGGVEDLGTGRGSSGRVSSGSTVEGRVGLLTRAGLQFAGNSYSIKDSGGLSQSVPMKTAYAGINGEADYFFVPSFGAHFRFMDTFGSMSAKLGPPVSKQVDRIPTNVTKIELDGVGRYFFSEDSASPSINARLGFHSHQMLIDPVNSGTKSVFLVSQKYQGLIFGVGTDIPLGSPQVGLRAGADFWLAPSLSEGTSGASGKAKSATGLDITAATYFNLSDTAGVDIGIEYDSFAGSFSGAGQRFNRTINNAKTTDSYILFGLNGIFRF